VVVFARRRTTGIAIATNRRDVIRALAGVCIAAASLTTSALAADAWPSRPITYVVPFTPGGSTDVIARTVGQKLSEALGQPVIIENKPGAAGAIGASYVAKAKPDGYTLFGGTISTHAINASLYKDLPYDPVKDFQPITLVAYLPNVLIVNPNLGVNSVQDLVALLKRDPTKRSFASSGSGTSTHLTGELFADVIGVPLTHIPYKGTPQAMQDVVGGQVPFMFDQMTAAVQLAQAGKLKILATTAGKRTTLAPDLPTMTEAGVPGFDVSSWQAIYAPAGTPKEIVQRLNVEIVKILKMPDVRDKLEKQLGMQLVGSTPEELTALMKHEIPRWAALVKKSGATP
jgi:tripartite-type tricarboxylate transporter receptor subunit TctC